MTDTKPDKPKPWSSFRALKQFFGPDASDSSRTKTKVSSTPSDVFHQHDFKEGQNYSIYHSVSDSRGKSSHRPRKRTPGLLRSQESAGVDLPKAVQHLLDEHLAIGLNIAHGGQDHGKDFANIRSTIELQLGRPTTGSENLYLNRCIRKHHRVAGIREILGEKPSQNQLKEYLAILLNRCVDKKEVLPIGSTTSQLSRSSRSDTSTAFRHKSILDLCFVLRAYILHDFSPIWSLIREQNRSHQRPIEQALGINLVCASLEGQSEQLNEMQTFSLFRVCSIHHQSMNRNPHHQASLLLLRLCALNILTKHGHRQVSWADDLLNELLYWFELVMSEYNVITRNSRNENMFRSKPPPSFSVLALPSDPLSPVFQCLPLSSDSTHQEVHREFTKTFMKLLIRVTKSNYSALSKVLLAKVLSLACELSLLENDYFVINFCLPLLDIFACKGLRPSLHEQPMGCARLVSALCLAVNNYSAESWEVMQHLLKGKSGLIAFEQILLLMDETTIRQKNKHSLHNLYFLRGGVFFTGMTCWGSQRIESVHYPFAKVLIHFSEVVKCNDAVVIYEVLSSVRRLVLKYGDQLVIEWERLVPILKQCSDFISQSPANSSRYSLTLVIKEILEHIEALKANNTLFLPDLELNELMLTHANLLSSVSLRTLLGRLAMLVHPVQSDWLQNMTCIMKYFFQRTDLCLALRQEALSIFESKLWLFQNIYADELIGQCFLPFVDLVTVISPPNDESLSKLAFAVTPQDAIPKTLVKQMLRFTAQILFRVQTTLMPRLIEVLLSSFLIEEGEDQGFVSETSGTTGSCNCGCGLATVNPELTTEAFHPQTNLGAGFSLDLIVSLFIRIIASGLPRVELSIMMFESLIKLLHHPRDSVREALLHVFHCLDITPSFRVLWHLPTMERQGQRQDIDIERGKVVCNFLYIKKLLNFGQNSETSGVAMGILPVILLFETLLLRGLLESNATCTSLTISLILNQLNNILRKY